jgi:hypothetical protein
VAFNGIFMGGRPEDVEPEDPELSIRVGAVEPPAKSGSRAGAPLPPAAKSRLAPLTPDFAPFSVESSRNSQASSTASNKSPIFSSRSIWFKMTSNESVVVRVVYLIVKNHISLFTKRKEKEIPIAKPSFGPFVLIACSWFAGKKSRI